MANSEPGKSTSDTSRDQHLVFLSFREPDTRCGFTNNLYHALVDARICVFFDDEDLRLGERISDELEQAINDSKLYIPIFSKSYASSHWCLRELAKMVENKSKNGKKSILPIFYDVKPDDVKLKTSLYNEAISNLEHDQKKKFNSEEVKKWRQALQEVGHYRGWNWEPRKGDGELIKSVVHEVLVKLETRKRQVTDNLVGMNDHIVAINNLLDSDSGDVHVILIYGMGGIGKTTLAKIIFNRLCSRFGKNCSFLEDVRERSKTKEGLVELQKRLLYDISSPEVGKIAIADADQGINMIGETICNKEVLIVLDDVDSRRQIQYLIRVNSLCAGTIILVTSRDKSILNTSEFKDKLGDHEMVPLSDEDALELLCKHAFSDTPPADYYPFLKRIIKNIRGLPLALEAIGSSFFGVEDKEIWKERVESLKKTPHYDVLGKLKISYDALGENHQRIFLDIACFFVGENKTNPMYMWSDCEFCPNDAIDVLTKRCMMKVLDDDRFWMHDQFRDLGRKIARDERSRLWDKADFIREIKRTKDEERVEALRLSAWRGDVTVTSEQINRCPSIRFLSLNEVDCQGDFTGCLLELRWIHLSYGYVSPDKDGVNQHLEATNLLHLENAVVIDLCGLQFAHDVLESLIQGARKLKVLAIRANFSIRGTPTFSKYSVLEKLIFYDNSYISEIDSSIGRLQHLTELRVEGGCRLKKLPEQIGRLRNLRHLSLKLCIQLIELPESVSELESLTTLDVSCTRISRLPHSIGGLKSLLFLDVSHTPIAKMPGIKSQFCQLRTLKMRCCNRIQKLRKLPRSLTTLELTSRSLLTLPDLSDLTNLIELELSDGNHVEGWLGKVQTCRLSWIGRLSKLSKLSFRFPTLRGPTTQLSSLYRLKELTLQGVDLPTFERIPSNLTVLELYDAGGKQAHLDEDPQLEKETDTRRKRARTELADHRGGVFLFPRFQKTLRKFRLSGFAEAHDIRFDSTFESLEEFYVEECSSLRSLGGLSFLKNLKRLFIKSCESLQVIEGIDKLEFLHNLYIKGCRSAEVILDASSSKIPNNCSIYINLSGKLNRNPSNRFYIWGEYREKILNGTMQASDTEMDSDPDTEMDSDPDTEMDSDPDTEMETTDYETGTGDPLQKTNQESKDKKRKRKRQSAKQEGRRKRRKLQKKAWGRLFHHLIFFCRTRKMKRRKERARVSAKERETKEREKRA